VTVGLGRAGWLMERIHPMSSPDSMDPRDLDLLRRIEAGEKAFYPAEGQRGDEPEWLDTVERLRRPEDPNT
jgi:hypothetical protein